MALFINLFSHASGLWLEKEVPLALIYELTFFFLNNGIILP